MTYDLEVQKGLVMVTVRGVVDGGPDGRQLHDAVRARCRDGYTRLVLDCQGVTRCTAAGLGHLLGLVVLARNTGGDAVLARPPDSLWSFIRITGMDGAVQAYDSVKDAARALGSETLSNP
jgi:anti-anti-sigma factor